MKKLVFMLLSVGTFASSGIRAAASEVSEQSTERDSFIKSFQSAVYSIDEEEFKKRMEDFKGKGYVLSDKEKGELIALTNAPVGFRPDLIELRISFEQVNSKIRYFLKNNVWR